MSLIWKSPGEQPDPAAIERMRQHFPKPDELMPVAWFMGEIDFYESLAEVLPKTLGTEEFCRALNDIAGGIFCFPEVYYVPVWKAWFRYFLPDIILRADDPANFNDFSKNILVKAIVAFFNIYPHEINEEYPGFRDDVVQTLGFCAITRKLASESLLPGKENSPLFVDIWDAHYQIEYYGFASFTEVNISILFCLKYFSVNQIADWTVSLFQISSPQWHLQLIYSLAEWRTSLNLAQQWNHEEENFLRQILKQSGILDQFWIPEFKSFDEFIPRENVVAFEQVIASHFSFEIFWTWMGEILVCLNSAPYNIENGQYLTPYLQEALESCQLILFPESERR